MSTGPESVAREAVKTWVEGLDLGVELNAVQATAPPAGQEVEAPFASFAIRSVDWTPTRLRELVDPDTGEILETESGAHLYLAGTREAEFVLEFRLVSEGDADAVREGFPRALLLAALAETSGLEDRVGAVRLAATFEGLALPECEVSLYFEGSDLLERPEDTGTLDRWVLSYGGRAVYPWIEPGEAGGVLNLSVAINDRDPFALDDFDPA